MQIATLPPPKDSDARDRLLRTASALFYAEGINSVGVDRIVSDSNVTRATFYRHFPSKQDLVLTYLQTVHDAIEARQSALVATTPEPRQLLQAVAADICEQIAGPGFQGCAFICAAAEFQDPEDPIHRAITAHRAWFLGTIRDAFAATSHAQPDDAARLYVMLRDGAMVGGHLGDSAAAIETFRRGVGGLLPPA